MAYEAPAFVWCESPIKSTSPRQPIEGKRNHQKINSWYLLAFAILFFFFFLLLLAVIRALVHLLPSLYAIVYASIFAWGCVCMSRKVYNQIQTCVSARYRSRCIFVYIYICLYVICVNSLQMQPKSGEITYHWAHRNGYNGCGGRLQRAAYSGKTIFVPTYRICNLRKFQKLQSAATAVPHAARHQPHTSYTRRPLHLSCVRSLCSGLPWLAPPFVRGNPWLRSVKLCTVALRNISLAFRCFCLQ